MNVRKYSKTTVSLIVITVGLLLLGRLYIEKQLPYDVTNPFLQRIGDYEHLRWWESFVVNMSAWLMIVQGVLHAVVMGSSGLQVFSSMQVSISMCIPLVIAVYTPIDNIWFWLIVYIVNIIAIAWSYRLCYTGCCKDKRTVWSFIFKIKDGPTKEEVERTDSRILYLMTGILSAWFWILFISATIYTLNNKTVIIEQVTRWFK